MHDLTDDTDDDTEDVNKLDDNDVPVSSAWESDSEM